MLSPLDLSLSLDKETYQSQIKDLMEQLRSLQKSCWECKLPVVVVLEGWAAAGKGTLVKKMVNYMDPRGFTVHPILTPSPQEESYPFLWRFWQKLPAKGSIGIFYHSWYTHLLEDRLLNKLPSSQIPLVMRDINTFERQLSDDRVAIAKFWIHLSQKELKSRIKEYAENELESWRVRPEDWQQAKRYDEYASLAEEMITYTSTGPPLDIGGGQLSTLGPGKSSLPISRYDRSSFGSAPITDRTSCQSTTPSPITAHGTRLSGESGLKCQIGKRRL